MSLPCPTDKIKRESGPLNCPKTDESPLSTIFLSRIIISRTGEVKGVTRGRKRQRGEKGKFFATIAKSIRNMNEKQSGQRTGIQSSANREQSYFDRYQRNRSALSGVARVYSRILLLDGGARSARLYFAG